MLAFITSLPHPLKMRSPETVYRILERTLRSVCTQTHKDFLVVVTCYEQPKLRFTHPQIQFLIVDFEPIKVNPTTEEERIDMIRLEKGRKYLAALYYLRQLSPSHVMIFDADDYVSHRIVEIVLGSSSRVSWCIRKGYVYREGSRLIYKMSRDFNAHCGTSLIFDFDLFDLPESIKDVREDWIKKMLGSHKLVHSYLAEKGIFLREFPGRGAVYVTGTLQNQGGDKPYSYFFLKGWRRSPRKFLRSILAFRLLSAAIREEFTLERTHR